MMNRHNIKFCSVLISLLIMLYAAAPVFAVNGNYTVSTRADYENLVKKCTLDSWSEGKIVELLCDIDITGAVNQQIPTFSGTFKGNGYTISGVSIEKAGSNQGLFRYIRKGAVVSDLHIKGKLLPQGTKKYIGAVAGNNEGIIRNCSFDGTISADSYAGGIAGINGENGQIISSSVNGTISGEQYIGGISGKNKGLITDCENRSSINTAAEVKKKDLSDINTDLGAVVETIETKTEENDDEKLLPGKSDMGGIAGHSSGVIEGCRNYGSVGYEHVGYNVGGIAGRQSGYILGCENYGLIYGRKDIGGIAGQLEPDILLSASGEDLSTIRNELNRLHTLADNFINDTDETAGKLSEHFRAVSEYAQNAGDNAQALIDSGTNFVDDNIAEINVQMANLSNTVDKIVPVFEKAENMSKDTNDILKDIINNMDDLMDDESVSPDLNDTLDELQEALDDLWEFSDAMSTAFYRLNNAVRLLNAAIRVSNQSDVQKALDELSSAIGTLADVQTRRAEAVEKIRNIIQSSKRIDEILSNKTEIASALKEIAEGYSSGASALLTIQKNLGIVISNVRIDFSSLSRGFLQLEESLGSFSQAMKYLAKAMNKLNRTIDEAYRALHGYTWDGLDEYLENLNNSLKSLSYTMDDLTDIAGEIKDIVADLADDESVHFVQLGDDFRNASDGLFGSLSDISDELEAMRETFDSERDKFSGNLHLISNQFNVVVNLILNEADVFKDALGDKSLELSDYIVDVSDENINGTKQGKIKDCKNYAEIAADRNVGGIAGAMAIEYSANPEEDIKKPGSLDFVYQTKAVVQGCINEGKITGKKDAIGGITGYLSMGTVYECENYSGVESTGGDYVGGIAGQAEASVRKCYSKSAVSGRRYIGGVAGKAAMLTSSYAIAKANGDENIGAVAGGDDSLTSVRNCYFIDNGLGAVDGISFAGRAEPITYESLKNIGGIPKRFISFSIKFIADGEIVEEQDIEYGEDTARIKSVEIPAKNGYFGVWPEIEEETVTGDIVLEAEYKEWITTLASDEKDKDGKLSLALAEGHFTDAAEIHVKESEEEPPKMHSAGEVKVWDISLENAEISDGDSVGLRLLNADKKNTSVWRLTDSGWERIDAKKRGRYIKINTQGADSTICVLYEPKSSHMLLIVIGVLAAAALIIAFLRRRIKMIIKKIIGMKGTDF